VTDNGWERVVELSATGAAVIVATADADGRPSITRGWGPTPDSERRTMSLTITAPEGSSTLANLESNALIAVTLSRPSTYETIQVKGPVSSVEQPSQRDLDRAHDHLDRFITEVALVGVEEGGDRLFLGNLRTVSFTVESIFNQTPGSSAGTLL